MKITIFIVYIFLLNGFLSVHAMEKKERALVTFKNDEQMNVPVSLLKKCNALAHLFDPNYCPSSLEGDLVHIPLITRKQFRSFSSVLFSLNKSEDSLMQNLTRRNVLTLIRTIQTADYVGCTALIAPALQILMNKLKQDPTNTKLLHTISENVCVLDLPAQSIKNLKNTLFDQLAKGRTTHFKALLKDHGEPIENIATNGRFIVTKSDSIVQIFDLIDKDCPTWKLDGDFVDVAITDNNLVAIGHSDGTVQWGPFTSKTIKKHDMKLITHPGIIKVAINSQGSYIATGSYPDNIIKIWDGTTGTQLWEFDAHSQIKKLSFSSGSRVKYITYTGTYGITGPIEHYYKGTADLTTRTNSTEEIDEPNLKIQSFRNYLLATDIIPNGKYLNIYSYKSSIDVLFGNLSLEEALLLTIVFDHAKKHASRYPLYNYPSLMKIYKQSKYSKELIGKQVALNAFWSYWPL